MQTRRMHQLGVSIVEAMIGMGILAVGAIGFMHFMSDSNNSQTTLKLKMTRSSLAENLKRSAGNAKALTMTSELGGGTKKNPDFHACVKDGAAVDCTVTQNFAPLFLTDGSGVVIAGSSSEPAYFTEDGGSCQLIGMTQKNCPFQARARWKAECDGGAASCKIARRVLVEAILEPNPDYAKWGKIGKFKSVGGANSQSDISISIWNSVPLATDFTGQTGHLAMWISDSQLGESAVTQRKDPNTGRNIFGFNALDNTDASIPGRSFHFKTKCDVGGSGKCAQLVISDEGGSHSAIQFRTASASGAAGLQWSRDDGNSFSVIAMTQTPEGYIYQTRNGTRPFTFFEGTGLCVNANETGNCVAQHPVHLYGKSFLENELEVKGVVTFHGNTEIKGNIKVKGEDLLLKIEQQKQEIAQLNQRLSDLESALAAALAAMKK